MSRSAKPRILLFLTGFFLIFLPLSESTTYFCEQIAWARENGATGSVGLQVVPTAGGELVVLRVLDGSSAARGGMRPGDLILSVDGFDLRGSKFEEVVQKRLWGEVGTSVKLIYLRPGETGRHSVILKRSALPEKIPESTGVRILRPGKNVEDKEKGH